MRGRLRSGGRVGPPTPCAASCLYEPSVAFIAKSPSKRCDHSALPAVHTSYLPGMNHPASASASASMPYVRMNQLVFSPACYNARRSFQAGGSANSDARKGSLRGFVGDRPVRFGHRLWLSFVGGFIAALPHALGAPHPPELTPLPYPEGLGTEFVFASLATSLIFWLMLGTFSGWLYRRLG